MNSDQPTAAVVWLVVFFRLGLHRLVSQYLIPGVCGCLLLVCSMHQGFTISDHPHLVWPVQGRICGGVPLGGVDQSRECCGNQPPPPIAITEVSPNKREGTAATLLLTHQRR
jgi:hypothetical protein